MQKTKEICGNSIILYPLNTDNREEYLKVFKRASTFSELYAVSEDLWRTMSEPIGTDNDTTVRYIIYVKDAVCGFINYDMEADIPSIDIAIASEYRNNGYGYGAAKLLCEHLLSQTGIDSVCWYAMPHNKASIRIAEKLGGVQIDGRNILAEAMSNAFGKSESEYADLPATKAYIIKKYT